MTAAPAVVAQLSGWSNLGHRSVWAYARSGGASPTVTFGGVNITRGLSGFREGDTVAVFVSVRERQVIWFRNGRFVATNLPGHPLPELAPDRGYGVYVLVDDEGDEVSISRFGYRCPHPIGPSDKAAWDEAANRAGAARIGHSTAAAALWAGRMPPQL